ncbi:hypothetical protein BACUNI_03886 [Bacteroides uniformis ATCC 8492]|uniref:Uncharacterized protein n=1 Tax=Bacteroides uniformis (strain ATCC 8492 / DSM 6597 / CCUG 4942 / CIP 103695 / JCM 5828 / KCTC 5204 / NCTC 13054 / VPI 0061) TaxID=411479 RepID=A0ABC9N6I9_BACUC|nr:hypothetical protein BACUNI_03886 [Bacteroides uniformis ATCC 8492]
MFASFQVGTEALQSTSPFVLLVNIKSKIHKSFETVRFNSCFLYLCSAKTGSYYKERLYYTKRLYN